MLGEQTKSMSTVILDEKPNNWCCHYANVCIKVITKNFWSQQTRLIVVQKLPNAMLLKH